MSFQRRQGDKKKSKRKISSRKNKRKKRNSVKVLSEEALIQAMRSPVHIAARQQNSAGYMKDKRTKRQRRRLNTREYLSDCD